MFKKRTSKKAVAALAIGAALVTPAVVGVTPASAEADSRICRIYHDDEYKFLELKRSSENYDKCKQAQGLWFTCENYTRWVLDFGEKDIYDGDVCLSLQRYQGWVDATAYAGLWEIEDDWII